MHALDTFNLKLQDIDFVSSQNGEYPLDIMDMDMKTENLTSEMYFSNILGRGSSCCHRPAAGHHPGDCHRVSGECFSGLLSFNCPLS